MGYYTKQPTLLVLVSGDFAKQLEHQSNDETVREIMQILKKIYGSNIPQPTNSKITRWGKNPFAYGAYSSLGVNASRNGKDYQVMAEPLGNLQFAGEATEKDFPGTVHGAYLSGEREARRVLGQNSGTVRAVNNAITGFSYYLSDSVNTWARNQYGLDIETLYDRTPTSRDKSYLAGFSYGVTDQFEIGAGNTVYTAFINTNEPNNKGAGDTYFYGKYVFFNAFNQHVDIGINGEVTIPTGDFRNFISDGFVHYRPSAIVAKNLFFPDFDMQILGQIGVDIPERYRTHFFAEDNPLRVEKLFYNIAIGIKNDYAILTTEYNVEDGTLGNNMGQRFSYITPGARLVFGDNVSLGIGFPFGLTKASGQYGIRGSLSIALS